MKYLRFEPKLVASILDRRKRATWRLVEDKGLRVGDRVPMLQNGSDEPFGFSVIEQVYTKALGELQDEDFHGEAFFTSKEEAIAVFSQYYPEIEVNEESPVTVVVFRIEEKPTK